jgi:glycosyltransferase involved in cell wall biosynthesis
LDAQSSHDQSPDLSAIVLGYRAGTALCRVVNPLYQQLEVSGVPFELVIVANYWPDMDDATPQVARDFAETHPRAKVVAGPKAGAMGWDLRSGLAAARGNFLIVMDGDAQNPVEDLLRMYTAMRTTGVDLMKGRRSSRGDGLYRRLITTVYNSLFRLLFRTRGLWDINGKPKGLRRDAYERLELTSDDWFIDAEIVIGARRAGMRIGELPVVFHENDERPSFVRPTAILEFIWNIFRARFRDR